MPLPAEHCRHPASSRIAAPGVAMDAVAAAAGSSARRRRQSAPDMKALARARNAAQKQMEIPPVAMNGRWLRERTVNIPRRRMPGRDGSTSRGEVVPETPSFVPAESAPSHHAKRSFQAAAAPPMPSSTYRSRPSTHSEEARQETRLLFTAPAPEGRRCLHRTLYG